MIWTRVSDAGGQPVELGSIVAEDPGLQSVVASGSVVTESDADHTAQVDVGGLEPSRHYWYALESAEERSPIGRTKTLPAATDHVRFAVVSCAKFNAGFRVGSPLIVNQSFPTT